MCRPLPHSSSFSCSSSSFSSSSSWKPVLRSQILLLLLVEACSQISDSDSDLTPSLASSSSSCFSSSSSSSCEACSRKASKTRPETPKAPKLLRLVLSLLRLLRLFLRACYQILLLLPLLVLLEACSQIPDLRSYLRLVRLVLKSVFRYGGSGGNRTHP